MGLLSDLTVDPYGSTDDAAPLYDLMSAMSSVDGSVDGGELAVIAALHKTLPQLQAPSAHGNRPPESSRKRLLVALGKLESLPLRRQCFVVAVEVALASGGAHHAEDAYLEEVRAALRIDDAFARQTIEVIATKYACAKTAG